ncbi:hypothetical protein AAW02_09775 [Aeromonas dhakensis]|nr:hypothetical protein AAW03_16500 [Aeromonas dhakensis]PHS88184.1 hypothetical protein AAW02_09775 [Aeromonas dhakensis]
MQVNLFLFLSNELTLVGQHTPYKKNKETILVVVVAGKNIKNVMVPKINILDFISGGGTWKIFYLLKLQMKWLY